MLVNAHMIKEVGNSCDTEVDRFYFRSFCDMLNLSLFHKAVLLFEYGLEVDDYIPDFRDVKWNIRLGDLVDQQKGPIIEHKDKLRATPDHVHFVSTCFLWPKFSTLLYIGFLMSSSIME